MKRTPTKHVRIWLVVRLATGCVSAIRMRRCDAAGVSRQLNDSVGRDVFGIRPAFTSDTKGKR